MKVKSDKDDSDRDEIVDELQDKVDKMQVLEMLKQENNDALQ